MVKPLHFLLLYTNALWACNTMTIIPVINVNIWQDGITIVFYVISECYSEPRILYTSTEQLKMCWNNL